MATTRNAAPDVTAARSRVYLVEDSNSIRARLVDMLDGIGSIHIVGEAANAADAISGILQTHPDAVVLDIQLAGSSGVDVLRAVHQRAPEIIFIVLTNYPNSQYRRICLQSGASHFLDKTSEFGQVASLLAPGGQREAAAPLPLVTPSAQSSTIHTSH